MATPVRRDVVLAVSAALVAVAAPLAVHLLPASEVPLGARLLPLAWGPLVLAMLCRPGVAVLVAAAGPWLNWLLLGRPSAEMATRLGIEMAVFALIVTLLVWWQGRRAWHGAATFAAVLAISASLGVVPVRMALVTWPGLLILLGIGTLIARRWPSGRAAA
jgi:hypothetical protein